MHCQCNPLAQHAGLAVDVSLKSYGAGEGEASQCARVCVRVRGFCKLGRDGALLGAIMRPVSMCKALCFQQSDALGLLCARMKLMPFTLTSRATSDAHFFANGATTLVFVLARLYSLIMVVCTYS